MGRLKAGLKSYEMKFYWLVLGILAVWRITSLVALEDGPADVFVRLRESVGDGVIGKGLSCFYCMSLWDAAPFAFAIAEDWTERIFLWLALSGGAILLHRITTPPDSPAVYFEDKEN